MLTGAQKNGAWTTGRVAALCHVSPRVAAGWIDSGQLVGHRLTDGGARRVHAEDLEAFLLAKGFRRELETLRGVALPADRTVVLLGLPLAQCEQLDELMPAGTVLRVARCEAEAGALVERHAAAAVVLGPGLGRAGACAVASWLASLPAPRPALLVVAPDDGGAGWPVPQVAGLEALAGALAKAGEDSP